MFHALTPAFLRSQVFGALHARVALVALFRLYMRPLFLFFFFSSHGIWEVAHIAHVAHRPPSSKRPNPPFEVPNRGSANIGDSEIDPLVNVLPAYPASG